MEKGFFLEMSFLLPSGAGETAPLAGLSGLAVDAVPGEANNAASALNLQKALASEEQVGELASGGGEAIAGAGGRVPIRDVSRLLKEYGGRAEDWAKVRSSSFTAADGTSFEVHAYRNVRTGEVVEFKTKF